MQWKLFDYIWKYDKISLIIRRFLVLFYNSRYQDSIILNTY